MKRGDIIQYVDMVNEEGISIRRGMNFNIPGREYSIILMSVQKNAPYADRFEDNGTTIIYEGHDVQRNFAPPGYSPKDIDQPMKIPSGLLSENGKFYKAAQKYKSENKAKLIKVYEKVKTGIWIYHGFFRLIDAWIKRSGVRNVFKFKLKMVDDVVTS